jgi:predicted dienelactone hydrolase
MQTGFRTGHFGDHARPNWDGDGPRPLAWAAWYPASDDADNAAMLSTPQRYPLVLLSHGTGGRAMDLGWLAQRLAQHGYIAIGVNHHGNTLAEPYRAEGFLCWWERARDLGVLLDQLLLHDDFADRIDVTRISVVGYSLGGCAAVALTGAITKASRFQRSETSRDYYARGVPEFPDLADHLPGLLENSAVFRDSWARMSHSYRDPRFRAALLLAPGRGLFGFNEASLAAIDTPARIIVGGADPTLAASRWLHARMPASTLDVLAPEVGHDVFLPQANEAGRSAAPATTVDTAGVDRAKIHRHVTDVAMQLFEAVQAAT